MKTAGLAAVLALLIAGTAEAYVVDFRSAAFSGARNQPSFTAGVGANTFTLTALPAGRASGGTRQTAWGSGPASATRTTRSRATSGSGSRLQSPCGSRACSSRTCTTKATGSRAPTS